ncbi:MAG: hypothetical protein R3208_14915 [Ketobacteraceae bacterium]|nr:hypothetical protein [Ketobacteraceae bacterium]
MSRYDDEYYIVETEYTPTQVFLSPTTETSERSYHYKRLTSGKPVFFVNGFKERDARTGDKRVVSDVMFDGASFVVRDSIKPFLDQFDIESMQLHPAVVIDDHDVWHDNYWYLNFYGELDCWDRNSSEYEYLDDDDDTDAMIDKYSLNPEVLDAIPEEKRLLFKMDGAATAYVFAHKRVVKYFLENAYTGIRFFKVANFREGDQHL